MTAIAITGGIGTGKSTTARILSGGGLSLIDTDDLAREVVKPGSVGLAEVVRTFGPTVLVADGTLDRVAMASRIFADAGARAVLEGILHPLIHAGWQSALASWRLEGRRVGFVVIPLLYEKGYEGLFDRVVALHCSDTTQWRRLEARGWSGEQIRGRLAAQLPSSMKAERAGHVVWTEGSLGCHGSQWDRILESQGWLSGCQA